MGLTHKETRKELNEQRDIWIKANPRPAWFDEELQAALPKLRRVLHARMRAPNDVIDDLMQEVCMRALRNWDRYERGTGIGAWLFVIARNKWTIDLRTVATRNRLGEQATNYMRSPTPDPEWNVVFSEVSIALDAIRNKDFVRAVVKIAQGNSIDEIAAQQYVPEGTIKSRVSRVRDQLRGVDHLLGA